MRLIFGAISLAGLLGGLTARAQENANQISIKAPESVITSSGESKRYSGKFTLSLTGRRFDDEIVNSRFTRAMLAVEVDANFAGWLQGRFAALQNFTTGATSNLYGVTEGGSGSNSALIDEVYVSLLPFRSDAFTSTVSAGIISLGANPILSAMSSQSWMAGQVELKNKGTDGFIALTAGQGTPSSGATSNRVVDEDTLPIYTTAALNGKLEILKSGWSVGAAAAHFVFTDLASQAASDSQKLGATVSGNGKGGFLFAYDYRGMEYAGLLEKKFADGDKLSFRSSTMRNELAPTGQNRAVLGKVEYDKAFNVWKLKSSITAFRVESDAIPATYAVSSYGFTNRKGAALSMKLENKKEKYALFAGYTKAGVLETDVRLAPSAQFQADREIYSLGAEVTHDIF